MLSNFEKILSAIPESFKEFLGDADLYLDDLGAPVAFRRLYIREWLKRPDNVFKGSAKRKKFVRGLKELREQGQVSEYQAILYWYCDLYGELAFRPPYLSVLTRLDENKILEVKIGRPGDPVLSQKIVTCAEKLDAATKALLEADNLVPGLRALRELPATQWTLLATADYDSSISLLFSPRPNYHLSIWATHQTAEKILKAVLVSRGWSDADLAEKVNHHLVRAVDFLAEDGVILPQAARSALKRLDRRGGAAVRYAEDYKPEKRRSLRESAMRSHFDLLTFAKESQEALRVAFIVSKNYDIWGAVYTRNLLNFTDQIFSELQARVGGPQGLAPIKACELSFADR